MRRAAFLLSLALLAGCPSTGLLTSRNVAKLEKGMTVTDVDAIFGPAMEIRHGGKMRGRPGKTEEHIWRDGEKEVRVVFVDDAIAGWSESGTPPEGYRAPADDAPKQTQIDDH